MKTIVPRVFFTGTPVKVPVIQINNVGWHVFTNYIERRIREGARLPLSPKKHDQYGITILDMKGDLIVIHCEDWASAEVKCKHFNSYFEGEVPISLSHQTARTP